MPIIHPIRAGETIVMVAELYGFRAWETIAEASENAELVAKRGGPHALAEGDELHIPDPERGERVYATGTTHKAVVRVGKPLLEIIVYTEFRRVPDGVVAGAKTGTIRGWKRGAKVPALPVRAATISIGPGTGRTATTDRKGVARCEALTDGAWTLRLDPDADQLSPGPALPTADRDHALDWGKGDVARGGERKAGAYEVEYRPLELELEVVAGAIAGVKVVSPCRKDRPHHAVCFWKEGIAAGGRGVEQVLEIDLKPDFLRKLVADGVRPRTNGRGAHEAELFEIHHTGGNLISGAIAQFTGSKSKSGIHFLNDRDGHVVRMADDRYSVRHGGGTNGKVNCAWDDGEDINARAIGVENIQGKDTKVDDAEQPFTDAQIESLIGLVRAARDVHGIEAWRVMGHGDVYTGKARSCPGPLFPWKQLEDAALVVRPLELSDTDVEAMFGGFFAGTDGAKRKLVAADFDVKAPDGTWSLQRGGRVIASGLAEAPVAELNRYLHLLAYVPNRSGRGVTSWASWTAKKKDHEFGAGTRAALQCFKGHYGALDRKWLSKATVVDIATARIVYGCFRFVATLRSEPALP